ncbi:MAG: PhoH family protein [Planctomycetota bacterium]
MASDMQSAPKLFVLDTNVVLHDSRCIGHFEENDIAIPITVLEELDRFKRGNEEINFHAREFLRQLDELSGDVLQEGGVSIGEGHGTVRVIFDKHQYADIRKYFHQDTPDHRILSTVYGLKRDEPDRRIILVSKDNNLRMKAKSLGIPAQDYTTDKVESIEKIYTGKRFVENVPSETIDRFYQTAQGQGVAAEDMVKVEAPNANENFILRNGSKSVLATYDAKENAYHRVEKITAYGISPRNAEQSFALKALMNPKIQLVTISGKAGTGKTLLALAGALECRSTFRQIYLARPIVPLSNRDIGFLPGDIHSKIDPYMQPLFDNLSVIRNQFQDQDPHAGRINDMLESEKLLITPLAYIRGRTFQKVFFIVDEAQNLTPHEVKTIITRAGEGTKVVFTGDIHQIDQPYLDTLSNGLSYLIHRMVGQPIYAHVTLEKGERSALAELASNLL